MSQSKQTPGKDLQPAAEKQPDLGLSFRDAGIQPTVESIVVDFQEQRARYSGMPLDSASYEDFLRQEPHVQFDIESATGEPASHRAERQPELEDVLTELEETPRRYSAEPLASAPMDDETLPPRSDEDAAHSRRLSEFLAFREITSNLEERVRAVTEELVVARAAFSSLHPVLQHFEHDIQISDGIEDERNALAAKVSELSANVDSLRRDFEIKSAAHTALVARNTELGIEIDRRRYDNEELSSKNERLSKDLARTDMELSRVRAEIVRMTAALERETAEVRSLYASRSELSNNLAKVQQQEALVRHRMVELKTQHETLLASQVGLISEQEKLRNELRVAYREKAEMQNAVLSLEDKVAVLDAEIQSIQKRAAAETYSAKVEVEIERANLRTAEKSATEAEIMRTELLRQIRDAENARLAAEDRTRIVQDELDALRREQSVATFKLSDVNLKHMTDLISLDQQREYNKEIQTGLDTLMADKRRLEKFEALYKAAERQISTLSARLKDTPVDPASARSLSREAPVSPAPVSPAPAAAAPAASEDGASERRARAARKLEAENAPAPVSDEAASVSDERA